MAPLTPFGKPLTQRPVASADVPIASATAPAGDKPVSASQWISLARATWTWILRPLWHLCVQWPVKLIFSGLVVSTSKKDDEDDDWHARRQSDEMTRRMTDRMRQ